MRTLTLPNLKLGKVKKTSNFLLKLPRGVKIYHIKSIKIPCW